MHCALCGNHKTIVTRSSIIANKKEYVPYQVKRRRQCLKCERRFTTLERVYVEEAHGRKWVGEYAESARDNKIKQSDNSEMFIKSA